MLVLGTTGERALISGVYTPICSCTLCERRDYPASVPFDCCQTNERKIHWYLVATRNGERVTHAPAYHVRPDSTALSAELPLLTVEIA